MKSFNSLSRIASLLIFMCVMLMSTLVSAQNEPQLIQVNKKENPVIKIQTIKTPAGNHHPENRSTVHYITIEKSDKMEIVNSRETDSNSKQVSREKAVAIRKMKSEKIDQ